LEGLQNFGEGGLTPSNPPLGTPLGGGRGGELDGTHEYMLEKSINTTAGCTNDIEMSANRKSILPIIERHYNQAEVNDNNKSALTTLNTNKPTHRISTVRITEKCGTDVDRQVLIAVIRLRENYRCASRASEGASGDMAHHLLVRGPSEK